MSKMQKRKIKSKAKLKPKKIQKVKPRTSKLIAHSSHHKEGGQAKLKTKSAYSVLLDPSLCKSCQICIEVCPKGVFEKTDKLSRRGYHIIKVARPSECIGCLECEVLCPDLAITVEKAT